MPIYNPDLVVNLAASNTTYTSGTVILSGGANVTVGTNGQTVTISAAAGGAGIGGIAVNALTTYTSGTVVLSAGNNITLGTNAQTVTISGVAAQTNQSVGWYAVGNSTQNSSTTLDARTLSIGARGNISAGYSNGTIQLSVTDVTLSRYGHNTAALVSLSSSNLINTSQTLVYMLIPENVSFSRVDIPISISLATSATTNTAAIDISYVAVIYSRNASTLNPIVGQSSTTTYTWASNTGVYNSLTGPRLLSFNLATVLSAGDYWLGIQASTHSGSSIGLSTTALSMTHALMHPAMNASATATIFADISAATNATINDLTPFQGINSVSISNTTMTRQLSQMTMSGTAYQRANLIVILRNV